MPTSRGATEVHTGRAASGRLHSHTLNMKLSSDPRTAVRLRPAHTAADGLGMLAISPRAYRFHVCGHSVRPEQHRRQNGRRRWSLRLPSEDRTRRISFVRPSTSPVSSSARHGVLWRSACILSWNPGWRTWLDFRRLHESQRLLVCARENDRQIARISTL